MGSMEGVRLVGGRGDFVWKYRYGITTRTGRNARAGGEFDLFSCVERAGRRLGEIS